MKLVDRKGFFVEDGRSGFSFDKYACRGTSVRDREKGVNYDVRALGRIKVKYTASGR
tara:strand:- start:691 stop:861 length:171 start_codon:yes stop_codon:yes gene_type:complete